MEGLGFWFNSVDKQTKLGTKQIYICDFSRGVLNARFRARIQHLLRGHKYSFFYFMVAVFGGSW